MGYKKVCNRLLFDTKFVSVDETLAANRETEPVPLFSPQARRLERFYEAEGQLDLGLGRLRPRERRLAAPRAGIRRLLRRRGQQAAGKPAGIAALRHSGRERPAGVEHAVAENDDQAGQLVQLLLHASRFLSPELLQAADASGEKDNGIHEKGESRLRTRNSISPGELKLRNKRETERGRKERER